MPRGNDKAMIEEQEAELRRKYGNYERADELIHFNVESRDPEVVRAGRHKLDANATAALDLDELTVPDGYVRIVDAAVREGQVIAIAEDARGNWDKVLLDDGDEEKPAAGVRRARRSSHVALDAETEDGEPVALTEGVETAEDEAKRVKATAEARRTEAKAARERARDEAKAARAAKREAGEEAEAEIVAGQTPQEQEIAEAKAKEAEAAAEAAEKAAAEAESAAGETKPPAETPPAETTPAETPPAETEPETGTASTRSGGSKK